MLRQLFTLSLAAGLFVFATGCQDKGKSTKTESAGGTGNGAKAALELPPPKEVTIKQGGEAKVTIELKRTNTKDDVNVKFADLPKGVTATGEAAVIAGDKDQVTVTLKAADDAEVTKKKTAKVTVTDKTGKLTTDNTFHVTVEKK